MSSRKLKVTKVQVETVGPLAIGGKRVGGEVSLLQIWFSRKLSDLEVSGVQAVLEGTIK